jgi:hypothetical protein
MPKLVTNSFGNRNFRHPMRRLNINPRGPKIFLEGGGREGGLEKFF